MLYCYRVFNILVTDREPESEGFLAELVKTYRVRHVITSVYYLQGNSLIERGHKLIINILSKLTKGSKDN